MCSRAGVGHAVWSLGMGASGGHGRRDRRSVRRRGPAADIPAATDWHLVTPADLGSILAATSPRVHQRNAGMYRQTGIDADTVARTGDLLAEMLAGGRSLTRPEIGERLAAHRRSSGRPGCG